MQIPVELGRDDARRRAAAELAKAKYGHTPVWLDQLQQEIGRWLARVAAQLQLGGGHAGLGPVGVIAVVLLLAAVLVIVWRVGVPRLRHARREERLDLDPAIPPSGYRARATAAAARGDYRTAAAERFRALVRELEDLTVLEPRPARTATEVAVGAGLLLPGARTELDRAAGIFNDVWYGDQPADLELYQELCRLENSIGEIAGRADLTAAGTNPPTDGR